MITQLNEGQGPGGYRNRAMSVNWGDDEAADTRIRRRGEVDGPQIDMNVDQDEGSYNQDAGVLEYMMKG